MTTSLATVWVDIHRGSFRYAMDGGAVIATVSQTGKAWRGTVGEHSHYWSNRHDARDWCDKRLLEEGWLLPLEQNPAMEELQLLRRLEASLDACLGELQTHHDALKAFRRRAP